MPSNFRIGDPAGANWLIGFHASDGTAIAYRCRVNGFVFVESLQSRLGDTPPGVSFDGHRYGGDMVAIDGRWGPVTSRVLWIALRGLHADPALLTAVAYEAGWRGANARRATPVLGIGSIKGAIWLMHQSPVSVIAGGVPLSAINVPDDTVYPEWLHAGTVPIGTDLPGATCELLDYDDPVMSSVTTDAPPPPVAPDAAPAVDPAPIPPPQTQDVTDDIARASGLQRAGGPGSQLPWSALLIVAAGVGLVAWSTRSLNKAPGARRGRK